MRFGGLAMGVSIVRFLIWALLVGQLNLGKNWNFTAKRANVTTNTSKRAKKKKKKS